MEEGSCASFGGRFSLESEEGEGVLLSAMTDQSSVLENPCGFSVEILPETVVWRDCEGVFLRGNFLCFSRVVDSGVSDVCIGGCVVDKEGVWAI